MNKVIFTDNIEEATKVSYDETNDLVPLIELYTKSLAFAEIL